MLTSKRILVTGGNGFLGRCVVPTLIEAGGEVFAPRRRAFDLIDRAGVDALFERCRPDVVIHLAADVGGIGYNQQNPGRLFYNNAMMGLNVVEACRTYAVEKVVLVGTVCAYPKFTPVPFREESLWDGYPEETNAPYGLAKRMLLVQAQAYRQQYRLNAIYLLPVNLYGPGDNFDEDSSHVIPALIRKLVEAKRAGRAAVEVWGSGRASREFLYVEDAAEGIVLATERYDKGEPINLGTGNEITIADLAATLKRLVGYEGELVFDPSRPDGQSRRCLDISAAEREFGFVATTDLETGLRRTVDWYLQSALAERASPAVPCGGKA